MSRKRFSLRPKAPAAVALAIAGALAWSLVRPKPALDEPARSWAARAARALLRDGSEEAWASVPAYFRGPSARVAAVSAYGPAGAFKAAVATGPDAAEALRSAARGLRERWTGGEPTRVQIELASREATRLPAEAVHDGIWRRAPLGEVGVYVAGAGWERRYFPSVWAQSNWASENRALDLLTMDLAVSEGDRPPVDAASLSFWTFPAEGFVEAPDRASTLPLSGGRPARGSWSRGDLLAGAREAGRWLVRAQLPSGRYHYQYDALQDEFDDSRYNLPRHCGTTYSLFQLHSAEPDRALLEAGRQALAYLEPLEGPGKTPGARYLRDEAGRGTLGSSALALVAWTERLLAAPASAAELEKAKVLGRWILEMQRPDGSFQVAVGPGTDPNASDAESYYPGEALFALLRLYGATKDERWLAAARRGSLYRLAMQKLKLPVYDTWFVHALAELNTLEPSERFVRHGELIARRMVATLKTDESGPYAPTSLGALCSRVEGVVSAARMFRSAGRKIPGDLEEFLRAAAPRILEAQYGPENSYYLPNPERARGAFMGTTLSHKARVDVIHHCLSAYLGLAAVLD